LCYSNFNLHCIYRIILYKIRFSVYHLLHRRAIICNSPFYIFSRVLHMISCHSDCRMSRLSPSVSHFAPLFRFLSVDSCYKSHSVFMKTSTLADFETFMLSCYETTLLTLWHSRRGQGAAVGARKSPITWACKYFTYTIDDLHIALRAARLLSSSLSQTSRVT